MIKQKKKPWKLKKLNKKITNTFVYVIMMQFVLIGCFGLIFGTFISVLGFHNADLGQNMRWLEATYNITLHDITSSGDIVDSVPLYSYGIKQILSGVIILLISCFLFTFGVALAFYELEKYMIKGVKK